MSKIAGIFVWILTAVVGAIAAAYVLISTIHYGLESLLLTAITIVGVLILGALFYSQLNPQDH